MIKANVFICLACLCLAPSVLHGFSFDLPDMSQYKNLNPFNKLHEPAPTAEPAVPAPSYLSTSVAGALTGAYVPMAYGQLGMFLSLFKNLFSVAGLVHAAVSVGIFIGIFVLTGLERFAAFGLTWRATFTASLGIIVSNLVGKLFGIVAFGKSITVRVTPPAGENKAEMDGAGKDDKSKETNTKDAEKTKTPESIVATAVVKESLLGSIKSSFSFGGIGMVKILVLFAAGFVTPWIPRITDRFAH